MGLIYLRSKAGVMVHVIKKRTRKNQMDAIVRKAVRRARKKEGTDFSDLVGTAPLHEDPVKFQRTLRDEA